MRNGWHRVEFASGLWKSNAVVADAQCNAQNPTRLWKQNEKKKCTQTKIAKHTLRLRPEFPPKHTLYRVLGYVTTQQRHGSQPANIYANMLQEKNVQWAHIYFLINLDFHLPCAMCSFGVVVSGASDKVGCRMLAAFLISFFRCTMHNNNSI